MKQAWILMTAMPPTKGHQALISFGASLADKVHVIVCTQPDEPFANERFDAISYVADKMASRRAFVHHLHRTLEQDPAAPGFWEMWRDKMLKYGVKKGDYIVSSEPYGAKLAELTGAIFMPFDPNRELINTKATSVREDPIGNFSQVMREFQPYLRTEVVVFGAESTGKTTLSKELARNINGDWFFEWARPYLKTKGPEISVASMTDIWHGQTATQVLSFDCDLFYDKPYVVFDTDLYSTIGYWEQPHWKSELGEVPAGLINDARRYKADLYIITRSNIPFEAEDIRYGGTKRESSDDYWINVAKKYNLNYIVLEESDLEGRLTAAADAARLVAQGKTGALNYDRGGF